MARGAEDIMREVEEFGKQVANGRDEYTGGPKIFHHMGNTREAAWPWIPDIEIAGMVRMLMRSDICHEPVVCAARDRILHLSEELARVKELLGEFHAEVFAFGDEAKAAGDLRTHAPAAYIHDRFCVTRAKIAQKAVDDRLAPKPTFQESKA